MKSWHPPLILLALILPGVIGFALGGPGFGIMLAGFCLVGLVVVAMRLVPNDPIGDAGLDGKARKLLVITTFPIEDPASVQRVADEIEISTVEPASEVRLLTPATNTFLARWATDFRAARRRAQQNLVISVASLTLAGVDTGAKVGDENLVQAVEDELFTYEATDVILVTRQGDGYGASAAVLEQRLKPTFRHVTLTVRP